MALQLVGLLRQSGETKVLPMIRFIAYTARSGRIAKLGQGEKDLKAWRKASAIRSFEGKL